MAATWGKKPLSFTSVASSNQQKSIEEDQEEENDDDVGDAGRGTTTTSNATTTTDATTTKIKVPPPSILKKTQQIQQQQASREVDANNLANVNDDDERDDDEEELGSGGEEGDYENPGNVPSRVASYIRDFHTRLMANEVGQVRYLYYKAFKDVTKAYYLDSEWPSVEDVAPLCEGNQVFLLCYRELATRHIFMHGQPQLHHRFESWTNYRALFDLFLEGELSGSLYLPVEWLNDMVDEFIYQFQDFHAFKFTGVKSQAEAEVIRNNPNVWRAHTVLAYLVAFADRAGLSGERNPSAVAASVSSPRAQQQQAQQSASSGRGGSNHKASHIPILKAMGAFALVGLARLHNSLCDYRTALRVVDAIDLDNQRELVQTNASTLTLYYNVAFAYLMSRRYADAVATCSRVLVSHRVNKEVYSSYAEDLFQNKYDKVVALASLAAALSPGVRLDEQVKRQIADRLEKISGALASGSIKTAEEAFEEAFAFACPKFVSPSPNAAPLPGLATPEEAARAAKEPYRVQLRWFLQEVRQQASLPTVRSFLKLYKSIPIEKLAAFCAPPPGGHELPAQVDAFRQALIFIKSRGTQTVRAADGTPASRGSRVPVSDVHFYVSPGTDHFHQPAKGGGDMVHILASGEVAASARSQHFSRYFVSQTLKLQNVIDEAGDKGSSSSSSSSTSALSS